MSGRKWDCGNLGGGGDLGSDVCGLTSLGENKVHASGSTRNRREGGSGVKRPGPPREDGSLSDFKGNRTGCPQPVRVTLRLRRIC